MNPTPAEPSARRSALTVVFGLVALAAFLAAAVFWNKERASSAEAIQANTNLTQTRSQVAALKKQLDAANAESTNRQKQIEEARAGIARLQAEVTTANSLATKLKEQLDQAKVAADRARKGFEQDAARAAGQQAELQSRVTSQASELQSLADRLKELDAAKTRAAQLQQQLDAATGQLGDLQARLNTQPKIAAQTKRRDNPSGHVLLLDRFPGTP